MTRNEIQSEFDKFFEFPAEDRSTVSTVSALLFAEHIAQLERSKAPAWRDAPDVPGLWVNSINVKAVCVTPHHIEFSSWKNTGAKWFGPIPPSNL